MYALILLLFAAAPNPYTEAYQKALKEDEPLLVMLGATWCGPCHHVRDKVLPVLEKRGNLRDIVYVYIDIDEYRQVAAECMKRTKSNSIPQLLICWRFDGKENWRYHIGIIDVDQLTKFIAVKAPPVPVD